MNALRSANLVGMRHHFSVFITNVKKGLSTSDVEGLKSTLNTYYTNMLVLGDIESIITYLVNKNYWNYLNCEHLFLVIDTYGNDALKKEKKEFEKRRISYSVATKLQEYLSGRRDLLSYKKEARGRSSNKHRRSSSEYRGQLSMKLEIDVSTSSLNDIEKLWSRLANVGLPKIGVVLDSIIAGCVHIIWTILLPSIALDFRKKATQPGAAEFFMVNKIVQVILNKECIYPAGHLTSSSIANKLSASESIEEEPAELSGSEEEPDETQDEETVTAEQSLEEEESTVNDAAEEVKSKEKDSKDISDEPVKSEPPTKEKGPGIVSILIIVY